MRTLEIRGSHSGHTLIAAVLDCHCNVIVDNAYGIPRTIEEILESKADITKWTKGVYSFEHHIQRNFKSDILWAGNTGKVENPEKIVGAVRDPYVMAFSLLKKHKTADKVVDFMDNFFAGVDKEYKVFYEDILESPVQVFLGLAEELRLQPLDYWLSAGCSLVRKDIPQPRLNVDLSKLFNKYDWLGGYK